MLNRYLSFSIIFIFILYCLIFTFLNEPLLGFASDFNENYKKNLNLNSDFITTYSFNKDLISGISLKSWSFAPNYHFIEILLTFFPTLIASGIDFYVLMISPLQLLLFSLIIVFLQKDHYNTLNNLSNILLTFLIIFLFLKFFDIFLLYIVGINSYASFFLEQLFHTLGTHSLSGVIAVLMYYYYFCHYEKKQNNLIFYLLFFTFSFSDVFFAIYFLSFYGFVFLFEKKIKNIKVISILVFLTFLGILFTYIFNPNLKIHIINKFFFKGEEQLAANFSDPVIITFSLFLILLTLFFYLKKNNKLPKYYEPLFYGCVLVHLFNLATGLIKDFYSIKYSSVTIPVTALYFLIYLRAVRKEIYYTLIVIVSCSTLLLLVFSFNKGKNIFNTYEDEVTCIKNTQGYKEYNIVSSYWPGKVIFEKLNRENNFFQLTHGMGHYHWHSNTAWESNKKKNTKFQNYFLITEGIDPNILNQLRKILKVKNVCQNRILIVQNVDFKFTKNTLEFNQK